MFHVPYKYIDYFILFYFLRKGVVVLVLIYCLRIFWIRFRYYHFHFHSHGIFIFWKNLNVSYSATICGLFRRDNLKVIFIKVHSFFFFDTYARVEYFSFVSWKCHRDEYLKKKESKYLTFMFHTCTLIYNIIFFNSTKLHFSVEKRCVTFSAWRYMKVDATSWINFNSSVKSLKECRETERREKCFDFYLQNCAKVMKKHKTKFQCQHFFNHRGSAFHLVHEVTFHKAFQQCATYGTRYVHIPSE